MNARNLSRILFGIVMTGAVATMLPAPAAAQGGEGFLFKEPRISFGLRLGYAAPMGPRSPGGDTDIFGFTQELLTIEGADHDAVVFGGDFAIRVSPRLDLAVDVSQARSEVLSEFRDWVDGDDLPIEQTTTFVRRPVNLSARYFLWDRGRRVSQFAWVPRDWVPYVGAGVGYTWYEFLQSGDFVDFDTLEIFSDRLRSKGSSFTGQVLAGAQYSLNAQFILTGEARYRFGSVEMGRDFVGFDDIDLSGFHVTMGVGVRF